MNRRTKIDSIFTNPDITSNFLFAKYNRHGNQTLSWLDESLYFEEYKLIDIDKSTSYHPVYPKDYLLDIVYTLRNGDWVEVIKFGFLLEDDKFKLYYITINPNEYYKYRRPKVDKPEIHF